MVSQIALCLSIYGYPLIRAKRPPHALDKLVVTEIYPGNEIQDVILIAPGR